MKNFLSIIIISLLSHFSLLAQKESLSLNERPYQLNHLGHGIEIPCSLVHEEIHLLKKKYETHKILKHAFAFMEGADVAIAHDINFLKDIKKMSIFINKNDLMNSIKKRERHYF